MMEQESKFYEKKASKRKRTSRDCKGIPICLTLIDSSLKRFKDSENEYEEAVISDNQDAVKTRSRSRSNSSDNSLKKGILSAHETEVKAQEGKRGRKTRSKNSQNYEIEGVQGVQSINTRGSGAK